MFGATRYAVIAKQLFGFFVLNETNLAHFKHLSASSNTQIELQLYFQITSKSLTFI